MKLSEGLRPVGKRVYNYLIYNMNIAFYVAALRGVSVRQRRYGHAASQSIDRSGCAPLDECRH